MVKDRFTLSLPASCTYCIPGIFAVSEEDAWQFAISEFKKHRPKTGKLRKATVEEGMDYISKTAFPKEAASFVTGRASENGDGAVYDVELVVYGYYVFANVYGESRSAAAERLIENFDEARCDIGELSNIQLANNEAE